jgi:DNA-binding transcriptional LysR family regulator
VLDPPIPLPTFSLTQIWHERTHQSGAHRWFRQVLASAFEA